MTAKLTPGQARRIMLAAQGFGRPEPATVNAGHLQRVIGQVSQFQIDSVNVAVRAHYMPLFARLGAYDREVLHRAAGRAPRRVFEFWGHAAALIDAELQPAFRFRMAAARRREEGWHQRLLAQHPGLVEKVYAQVADRGPLTARQVEHDEQRTPGSWWNWSAVKHACEYLFSIGELTSAGRNTAFERLYDVPERVIPARILAQPTPSDAEAHLILARRAASALGVFTPNWIAEYFYTDKKVAAGIVTQLVSTGEVEPVEVRGWKQPAFLWAEAARPRRLHVDALVAPFDSLVFDRDRLIDTFGVHYRIGLYTPVEQRVHGYYVYLFVADDRIAARVDLKADRKAGRLLVQSAWLEDGSPEVETAVRLAGELARMAGWLGMGDVEVVQRGDLARTLAAAVSRPAQGGTHSDL